MTGPTGTLVGGVVAGNLESIGFNTNGYSSEDVVLEEEPKKKYGEASTVVEMTKRNQMDASLD